MFNCIFPVRFLFQKKDVCFKCDRNDFPKPITILCYVQRPINLLYFVKTIDDFKLHFLGFSKWVKARLSSYIDRFRNIKGAFKYVVSLMQKKNDYMLMCICSVIDQKRSQRTLKCGESSSNKLGYRFMCHCQY